MILGSHPNHQRYLFPVTQTDTCICSRVALFLYREKSIYKSEVGTQQQTTMFFYIEDSTKKGSTQALHLFVKIPSLQWTFIWTPIGWCKDFLKTLNNMRQTLVGKSIYPKSSTESTAGSSYLTEESGSILLTLLKSLHLLLMSCLRVTIWLLIMMKKNFQSPLIMCAQLRHESVK